MDAPVGSRAAAISASILGAGVALRRSVTILVDGQGLASAGNDIASSRVYILWSRGTAASSFAVDDCSIRFVSIDGAAGPEAVFR